MQYKYAKEQQDYSNFSSGRVFFSLPGNPAFPVRLASEIFQRCFISRETIYKTSAPCTLYDPCCGAAYHLSVLAYLHGEQIQKIIASDIDEKAVALAKRNLELLSLEGLEKRIRHISTMFEEYNKESHREALESGSVLKDRITALTKTGSIATSVFQANATDKEAIAKNIESASVDIVFTDVPYGLGSHWREYTAGESQSPLWSMLEALIPALSSSSIVAVVSNKQQKVSHEAFQRIEQFKIGKRRAVILKPV